MRYILLIAAFFCSSVAFGQGAWNPAATYNIWKGTKSDSISIVPRDTIARNTALLPSTGQPVGDYGRIQAKHGLFYFHDSIRNRRLAFFDDIIGGNYLTFSTPLTPLVTQPGIPIQPTDTLTQALGKLQQQINDFDGAFIFNQATVYQPANAMIQGSFHARANSYQFIAERPAIATSDAVIGFLTNTVIKGYVGLGTREFEDMQVFADVGKIGFQHNPDSGGIYFQETRLSPPHSDIYTTAKGGKWLIGNQLNRTDTAIYPIEITKPSDTSIWAVGKIRSAGATLRNDGEVLKIRANTQGTSTQDLSLSFYDANGTLIGQQGFISSDNKFWTYSPQPIQLLSDQYVQLRPRAVIGNISDDGVTSLQVTGANGYNLLRLLTPYTPTSTADSNGSEGSIARDDNYIYVKTSTGWKRASLSTF